MIDIITDSLWSPMIDIITDSLYMKKKGHIVGSCLACTLHTTTRISNVKSIYCKIKKDVRSMGSVSSFA